MVCVCGNEGFRPLANEQMEFVEVTSVSTNRLVPFQVNVVFVSVYLVSEQKHCEFCGNYHSKKSCGCCLFACIIYVSTMPFSHCITLIFY